MTADHPRILIVEDDPPIRRFLRASLAAHDFGVEECETIRDALQRAVNPPPDLIILDLGLPDGDGIEVIRRVREWSPLPIIVLSARGQESDKVAALDAGADDYLTKPFGVGELLARIRAALRRSARGADTEPDPVFTSGPLRVDLARRLVWIADQPVRLTPIEYRLLSALIKHAGKVVTHRQLLQEVWGPGHATATHYLRVYMGHLRHKIEADPAQPQILLTELGVGYRLAMT